MADIELSWQRSLFGGAAQSFDRRFAGVTRIPLDETAWVEYQPRFISGADTLFDEILRSRTWAQRSRAMYDDVVSEPRLTAPWNMRSEVALEPAILEDLRDVLSERYGVVFDSIGFNLYRDGRDSVAWHVDKLPLEIAEPVIALISLGERRRFLLRPVGGGRSRRFDLGAGDLLVTGGLAARTWEHSVPKVAQSGPRMSLAFRHGMGPSAHAHELVTRTFESEATPAARALG